MLSGAHVAVSAQIPVPLVMVTRLPATEHAPAEVITAAVLALVVADTLKLEPNTALPGAPVKLTVGASWLALVDWLAVAAR